MSAVTELAGEEAPRRTDRQLLRDEQAIARFGSLKRQYRNLKGSTR